MAFGLPVAGREHYCDAPQGYAFGARLPLPVYDINRLGDTALKGMHGYPPADDPDMLGFAAIWRYPTPIGGVDLGTVDALRFNPTVARLLDIPPRRESRPSR